MSPANTYQYSFKLPSFLRCTPCIICIWSQWFPMFVANMLPAWIQPIRVHSDFYLQVCYCNWEHLTLVSFCLLASVLLSLRCRNWCNEFNLRRRNGCFMIFISGMQYVPDKGALPPPAPSSQIREYWLRIAHSRRSYRSRLNPWANLHRDIPCQHSGDTMAPHDMKVWFAAGGYIKCWDSGVDVGSSGEQRTCSDNQNDDRSNSWNEFASDWSWGGPRHDV